MKTACMFILLSIIVFGQKADFFSERVTMKLSDDIVDIIGYYYFHNPTQTTYSQALYYPFIVNEENNYPDLISVSNLSKGVLVKYINLKEGILFNLTIEPKDTIVYEVSYRQKIHSKKAEYILTTTKYWKKPFTLAEYYVVIPSKFTDIEFSIPAKEDSVTHQYKYYSFKEENYLPAENLLITWR